MRLFIIFLSFVSALTEANANEPALKDPRLKEYQKIIDDMSPEQRAELLGQAKKVEAELKAMPKSEVRALKTDVLRTTKKIDFESVNAKEIDTSQPMTAKRAKKLMIEVHDVE